WCRLSYAAPVGRWRRAAPCRSPGRSSCRSWPPSRPPRARPTRRRRSCATGRALRSSAHSASPTSHVAAILPAHLIQRARDLPERADFDALHQLGEHIATTGCRLLQRGERRRTARRMACLEGAHRRDLILLLFLGRAAQLRPLVFVRRVGPGQEGIDADDRQRTVVFLRLVVERLLLDLAALVHGIHRAEHAATLRKRLDTLEDHLLPPNTPRTPCKPPPPPGPSGNRWRTSPATGSGSC